MTEKIKIKISPQGAIEYSVSGVKGKSCTDLTKAIDDLSRVLERTKTGEYCQIPDTQTRLKSKE